MEKASDIVPTIQALLNDKTKYLQMRDATVNMTIPNSTQNIIREITALLPEASHVKRAEAVAVRT